MSQPHRCFMTEEVLTISSEAFLSFLLLTMHMWARAYEISKAVPKGKGSS